ncbi:O-antigen ligase family protein [Sphingorhabdus sp. M41]|uniref:O-antigen ligase family protein n=1 Tax=Sphingorhabdus sp. M41 TaxID=1806885 RepID=UPI00078B39B4|nr:O-antigen ligase family protein [Sphingorhabdus sp. M41]AMO72116.1 hypothetical protein AZE99_09890 [Sphingorhabdus sp. M41]
MDWRKARKPGRTRYAGVHEWLVSNWLVLLFSVPIIHILFLTSFDGEFSDWQLAARLFFLPTLFLEIGIFILAVATGLNLSASLASLKLPVQILLFAWLGVLVAPLFYPDAVFELATRGALFWVVHVLFFAAVAHLMSVTRPRSDRISSLITILPLAASVAGLAILGFLFLTGVDSDFNWNDGLPGFVNLRHTGYIFGPAIALGLGHLAAWPNKAPRVHMLLLFINTAVMLWLGSRGPVLGIMFGFAVCFPFFPPMRKALFLTRSAMMIGSGALVSVILPIPDNSAFGAIQRFWASGTGGQVTSGRTDLWWESIQLLSDKPLFGFGAHQYQFVSDHAIGMFKHPHQSILQFLFDWGLVGGGIFLCLFGMLLCKAFVRSECNPATKLVSALMVSTLIGFSFVDGVFFYPVTIAITLVFLLWPITEDNSNG